MLIREEISHNVYWDREHIFVHELEKEKSDFEKLKEEGVLLCNNFDDPIWAYTNGRISRSLKFCLSDIIYRTESKKRNLMPFESISKGIKIYIIQMILVNDVLHVSGFLNYFRRTFDETNAFSTESMLKYLNDTKSISTKRLYASNMLDLIKFLKIDISDDVIHCLEQKKIENSRRNNRNSRKIPALHSFFALDSIIYKFSKEAIGIELKAYYPIVVWWAVGTVIPIRASCFLVMPFKCLSQKNNKYYLRVRRTNKKGNKPKNLGHSIEKDYFITKHEIGKPLYDLIMRYYQMTAKRERKYLLSQEIILNDLQKYNKEVKGVFKRKESVDINKAFILGKFDDVLAGFYEDIVCNKYGFDLIDAKFQTCKRHLEKIHPGDLRHYAILNMYKRNIDIKYIQDISVHEEDDTTFGYCMHENIFAQSTMVKIAMKKGSQYIAVNNLVDLLAHNFYLLKVERISECFSDDSEHILKEGACFSKQIGIEDCLKAKMKCSRCLYYKEDIDKRKDEMFDEYIRCVTREKELDYDLDKLLVNEGNHTYEEVESVSILVIDYLLQNIKKGENNVYTKVYY